MKGRFLVLVCGVALFLAARSTQAAVVVPTATGFDVTLVPADIGTAISLPDPGDPGLPLTVLAPGIEIAITNDTGITIPFAALTFTVPFIGPPPLALSVASPDLGLDPPEGPGIFDLAAAGPGMYVATIGMTTGGLLDDLDAIPDGTFIFLYAPDPIGGPVGVPFPEVTLFVAPEPSSISLLGLGLLGLLMRRRR